MSGGSYYVPDQSRFPIFMAFSLFLLGFLANNFFRYVAANGFYAPKIESSRTKA